MKKNEFIYLIAIFLLSFVMLCNISQIINISGKIQMLLYVLIMLIFIVKIINTKYKRKQIVPIIIIGLIMAYTSYKLSDYVFLLNYLAIIAIVGVDIKKIIKMDIIAKSLFLIPHSILYFYNYIFNYSAIVPLLTYTQTNVRHNIYFSHPNTAAGIVLWFVIDLIYISKNKKVSITIGSFLMLLYYYFTRSRTTLVIYILFLLIIYITKKGIIKKVLAFIEHYLFIIIAILNTIMIPTRSFINNPIIINLDKLLSKRIYFTNLAINNFGFHLFANNISQVLVENSIIVDSFYTRAFVSYGFIILIIIAFLYYVVSKKEKSNIDKAIIIIFPIYLFNELFPFNIGRAIPLLIIGNIIFNNKEIKTE